MARVPSAAARHVGQRIRTIRDERRLTQDELAVRSGIDGTNIRSYEGGRAMPNVYSLMRIANALETQPGDLLDGLTLEMFPTPSTSRAAQSR